MGGVGFTHLAFATRLAVHGLARFNRRAARRQTVDTDLRARHRSLSYSGRGIERVERRDGGRGKSEREGIDRIERESNGEGSKREVEGKRGAIRSTEYDEAIFDPRDRPRVRQVEPTEEAEEDGGVRTKV